MIVATQRRFASVCVVCAAAHTGWANSPAFYDYDRTIAQFLATDATQISLGKQLIDIEIVDTPGGDRYSGIWYPVNGTTWRNFQVNSTDWQNFITLVQGKNGRWLDVEVGYFGGQKRWSGIFLEDGDAYAWQVQTTNTDAQFQTLLDSNLRAGMNIVDFEAYTEGGQTTYSGVWVNDPNQPRTVLYYGLKSTEINDIFLPQYPLDPTSGFVPLEGISGRPIDFEKYFSTVHNQNRYAVIMAMIPGHEWALWYGKDEAEFAVHHATESDDDTHLTDLDVEGTGASLRLSGIWGDNYKTLNEVSPIAAEQDAEAVSANLQSLITQYETPDSQGPLGIVGIYAKNIRTNQSIGYRSSEPFYLASCSKVPIHIRLWQMHEAGQLNVLTDPGVTFNKNPWYVEDKNGGFDQFDFGSPFSLNNVDLFMIRASDNAATSIIMEQFVGRESLNNWLAGVAGVGRGFGPITGITELDRVIMWQGQVMNFPADPSYFLIPSWRWEPSFRGMGDIFNDMQSWANTNNNGNIPQRSDSVGHQRYYRMGMNTAEPRAFGRLLEKFIDGDFFTNPGVTLPLALVNFGGGTQMVDNLDGTALFPGFPPLPEPNSLTVYSKNGGKGGVTCSGTRYEVVNDTAMIQKGPETIVMVIFTKDNLVCNSGCVPAIPNCRPKTATPPGTAIRSYWHARMGYELFSRLMPDLKDRGSQFHSVSSTVVSPNGYWWVASHVTNTRGGDALPYKVRYYASLDTTLDTDEDYLIGTFQAPTKHPGDTNASVVLVKQDFPPNIPFNKSYYIFVYIDADDDAGEWDDRFSDNTAMLGGPSGPIKITVQLPLAAPDYDDDGDVDMSDVTLFKVCGTRAGIPVLTPSCLDRDFDGDRDADADDFGVFQRCYSGQNILFDPECVYGPAPT